MKNIHVFILAFLILFTFGCGASSNKDRELDLKERELALKEKELELNQKTGGTTGSTTKSPSKSPTSSKGQNEGIINGNSVIMRAGNSIQSTKMGNFKNGEKVTILDQAKPQNENQAIAAKSIKLYSDYNGKYMATLNKGKALVIEDYTGSQYKVSFKHPEFGKLFATVAPDELESISNEVWYKVKRASGEEGWVLGQFVNK